MTEHDHNHDSVHRRSKTDATAVTGIHRQLSTVGVAVGEAHQYLAALHTAADGQTKTSADVQTAEAKALRQVLEDARDALDDALQRVERLEGAVEPDRSEGSDQTGEPGAETDHPKPDLLWNTAPPVGFGSGPRHQVAETDPVPENTPKSSADSTQGDN